MKFIRNMWCQSYLLIKSVVKNEENSSSSPSNLLKIDLSNEKADKSDVTHVTTNAIIVIAPLFRF